MWDEMFTQWYVSRHMGAGSHALAALAARLAEETGSGVTFHGCCRWDWLLTAHTGHSGVKLRAGHLATKVSRAAANWRKSSAPKRCKILAGDRPWIDIDAWGCRADRADRVATRSERAGG